MSHTKLSDQYRTGAIVCEHIAHDRCSILSAFRTEGAVAEDSGWQFFCGKVTEEKHENAKIWLLGEVYELEPTLERFADMPVGVQVWRENCNTAWKIRAVED